MTSRLFRFVHLCSQVTAEHNRNEMFPNTVQPLCRGFFCYLFMIISRRTGHAVAFPAALLHF